MDTDFDLAYAQLRDPKRREGAHYPPGSVERISERLQSLGLSVIDYPIEPADYRRYFAAARYTEDFPDYYSFALAEKSLEHYLAAQLLHLSSQDIYIDIASQHSPVPEIYLRLFETSTYRQDLAYTAGLHGDRIGGDAAHMPVPAEFASKMALHCSFEHFEDDSDIRFMHEIGRVLKPGGAVCIVPFYLAEEYAIQTDPVVAVAENVSFEDGAILQCAQGWGNRHGRFYDPAHVVTRLAHNLNGLTMSIYKITNAPSVDPSCYVRFALLITKPPQKSEWQRSAPPPANQDKPQASLIGQLKLDELAKAQHLIETQQQQIQAYQRLLQTIQSTRAYKIARRLGRWEWLEQFLLQQE